MNDEEAKQLLESAAFCIEGLQEAQNSSLALSIAKSIREFLAGGCDPSPQAQSIG